MISETPRVSVIIPALNEASHIRHVIHGFQRGTYPNVIEILVADGGSTDGTQDIVNDIHATDPRVQLLHNPDRVQSAALNVMIPLAKGDVLVRADAHCMYSDDYIEQCVRVLRETGCVSVGGAQRFVAQNHVQTGIALAVRTFVGSGYAKYRDETYSGPADTVFLGCFRREIFEKVGLFRTEVHPNEDTELNLRILNTYPDGIYVSAAIRVWYFSRSTLSALWKQYYRYGEGVVKTGQIHGISHSRRAAIPFVCLATTLAGTLLEGLLFGTFVFASITVSMLLAFIVLTSIRIVMKTLGSFDREIWKSAERPPHAISRVGWTIITAILLNMAHAFGYASQWMSLRKFRRST
jgi:succinoglycan biosynthesis protein ExoA